VGENFLYNTTNNTNILPNILLTLEPIDIYTRIEGTRVGVWRIHEKRNIAPEDVYVVYTGERVWIGGKDEDISSLRLSREIRTTWGY
jgi:hypothetical protein